MRDTSTPRIIRLCYAIEESRRYHHTKRAFYDLMENEDGEYKPYFDMTMIVLALSSVAVLIYDIKHEIGLPARLFDAVVVTIFVFEYLLRAWLYNDVHRDLIEAYEEAELTNSPFRLAATLGGVLRRKWAYVSSPLAIVDILAILPSYRPLLILRLLLLFRLLKVVRYSRSLREFGRALAEKRIELTLLAMLVGFVVFAASTAMFMFEAGHPGTLVHSFFDAVYWAFVTIATVGYGDIVPVTPEGRVVTIVLILSGVALISFSTSIIVSVFTNKFIELREERVYSALRRMNQYTVVCGAGRIGEQVIERLARRRDPFVLIDHDEATVERARKRGYLAVRGNAASHDLLVRLGTANRASRILCLSGDDMTNVFVALTARHLNKDVRIIARANRKDSVLKLVRAGADHVVSPYGMVGMTAAEYIGQPVAFDAIYDLAAGGRGAILESVMILPEMVADSPTVGQLDLVQHRLQLFGVISLRTDVTEGHGGAFHLPEAHFYFNPRPDFAVHAKDILVVFGYEGSVRKFRKFLDQRRSAVQRA